MKPGNALMQPDYIAYIDIYTGKRPLKLTVLCIYNGTPPSYETLYNVFSYNQSVKTPFLTPKVQYIFLHPDIEIL